MKAKIIKKAYLQDLENPKICYIVEGTIVDVIGEKIDNNKIVVRDKGYNHVINYDCLEMLKEEN